MQQATTFRNAPKEYNESEVKAITDMVAAYNQSLPESAWEVFYILDTTGRYQVYYTLYTYRRPLPNQGLINPYTYVKNVTFDFLKLEGVIRNIMRQNRPIVIYSADNNDPRAIAFRNRTKEGVAHIPFGKYRGQLIADVWDTDKNYVMWFSKNYKQGTYTDFRGRERMHVQNEVDAILLNQARELISLFWEEMTEKNRAECTSKHIGDLGKRIKGMSAEVYSIKVHPEYTIINLMDSDGNLSFIYDKEYKLAKGDKIVFDGTPTKHTEKLGKKTTYFNRVSISSVTTQTEATNVESI